MWIRTRSFPNSFSRGSSARALANFCFTTGGSPQTGRRARVLSWTSRPTRAPAFLWRAGILDAALPGSTPCGRCRISGFARRSHEVEDYQLTVDLERCEVRDDRGFNAKFPMDEFVRHCLLNGLDDIGLTLQHEAEIAAYEALHPAPSGL